MAYDTLSKYDQDFAHAMALRLRLKREKKRKASEVSRPVSKPSETYKALILDRSATIAEAIRCHSGLTEEVSEATMKPFNV